MATAAGDDERSLPRTLGLRHVIGPLDGLPGFDGLAAVLSG